MPFTENKEGQTNSYTPIAQVVIEGMKEFDEKFEGVLISSGLKETYPYIISNINTIFIKAFETSVKQIGKMKLGELQAREMGLVDEEEMFSYNEALSKVQQLLNSTKEQIKL